jgi:hypothetical protein
MIKIKLIKIHNKTNKSIKSKFLKEKLAMIYNQMKDQPEVEN